MWKELLDSKKAVIFDLDGTLIDSMWIWKQIDIDYFASFNKELPSDYQPKIEGMSMYETAVFTIKEYEFDTTIEEMLAKWDEMAFDVYSNKVMLKECVPELLHFLKKGNYKIGLATSNSKKLSSEVLTKRGMIDYFDCILTGDHCIAGKPAPDVYLMAAKELNVNPSECLVFEDLCNGICAGRSAGMTTVAVWDDYSKDSWEDKKKEADYYISSYKEIIDEIY